MKILSTLSALFIVAALVEASEPPKKGADLQGTWQGVEVWDAGKKRTDEPAKLLQMKFRGDQFVVRYDGEIMLSGRFSVDDGKTPKTLTMKYVKQGGETSTLPAIYKIEKDRLSLCHPKKEGGDRPSAFKPSANVKLATFTREE